MRTLVSHIFVAVVGLLLAGALTAVFPGRHAPPAVTIHDAAPADIVDLPSTDIVEAALSASLVQLGTSAPFQGTGTPGINLLVDTPGSVVEWHLEGWANATAPPTVRACSRESIYFNSYDWTFQSRGNSAGAHGTFIGIAYPTPRMGPSGDQCLVRIGETGLWHLRLCVEGKEGGPRGVYDAPDGRHMDGWDLCIDQDVKVPS